MSNLIINRIVVERPEFTAELEVRTLVNEAGEVLAQRTNVIRAVKHLIIDVPAVFVDRTLDVEAEKELAQKELNEVRRLARLAALTESLAWHKAQPESETNTACIKLYERLVELNKNPL